MEIIMEIDITDFFNYADASDFSASIAEKGITAGSETWANAKEEGKHAPLLTTPEQIEALREYVKGFGAWSKEEIAGWSKIECNALFIQLVASNMREGGIDCNPDESEWREYETRAEEGNCSGNIYRGEDGRIYYYLGS
jgi:hypothetical protein